MTGPRTPLTIPIILAAALVGLLLLGICCSAALVTGGRP